MTITAPLVTPPPSPSYNNDDLPQSKVTRILTENMGAPSVEYLLPLTKGNKETLPDVDTTFGTFTFPRTTRLASDQLPDLPEGARQVQYPPHRDPDPPYQNTPKFGTVRRTFSP